MNEVFINAMINRIKAGGMTIEQVPIPYKDIVKDKLNIKQKG